MNAKVFALLGLVVALTPPTIFVVLHLIDSTTFAALAIALMGAVATFIHSEGVENAADASAQGMTNMAKEQEKGTEALAANVHAKLDTTKGSDDETKTTTTKSS